MLIKKRDTSSKTHQREKDIKNFTLLLPHEMFKKRNGSLEFTIGESIPYKSFYNNPLEEKVQVKLFKKHLYRIAKNKRPIFTTQKSIAHPEDRQSLKHELQQCQLLGKTSDGKKIYLYEYEKGDMIFFLH